MKQQHEEADKAAASGDQKFPAAAPEQVGVVHRAQQWMVLNAKKKVLLHAKTDADNLIASLTEQHNALSRKLTRKNSTRLTWRHTRNFRMRSAARLPPRRQHRRSRRARARREARADAKAALATTKAVTADQRNLTSLDKRVDNEKELSETYGEWIDLVSDRQRAVVQRVLIGIGNCVGNRADRSFLQHLAGEVAGKDQARSAAGTDTARDSKSFGSSHCGATDLAGDFWSAKPTRYIPGPCGRGLTVALKDFIVSFLGWFVLMGRNGIRLGDWLKSME